MLARFTVIWAVCFFLDVAAAQAQERRLDIEGFAHDILACGNESRWDICKLCVTRAWNNDRAPWSYFCDFLEESGFPVAMQHSCSSQRDKLSRQQAKWCQAALSHEPLPANTL
jgi:hypothetical protein